MGLFGIPSRLPKLPYLRNTEIQIIFTSARKVDLYSLSNEKRKNYSRKKKGQIVAKPSVSKKQNIKVPVKRRVNTL